MSEIFPLSVTALFVPVLAFFTGILDAKSAMAPFASTIIFLFMGGFTLAALLNKHGLDQYLATAVARLTHGNTKLSIAGFFFVTIFLSMWMSNTSTTAMMLPIALGIIDKQYPRMRSFLLLGTAYCANIGGLATIIGSPPNGIAAEALNLSFMQWFKVGLPTTIILFPFVVLSLWLVLKPEKDAELSGSSDSPNMNWTPQAIGTVCLFFFTVFCWIFSSPIGKALDLAQFDRMIAVLITALAPALGLIDWRELERKIDWGILVLFGGGLCLSIVLIKTESSSWIASQVLLLLSDAPSWLLIISCIALMIFLTELTSNTGSAAILIPIMMAMANQFNPAMTYTLVFGVGVAATCAFMLPVATPPNALAYGTGEIRQPDMLKAGLILNLLSIFVVYSCVSAFA